MLPYGMTRSQWVNIPTIYTHWDWTVNFVIKWSWKHHWQLQSLFNSFARLTSKESWKVCISGPFVKRNHQWLVESPNKGPIIWKVLMSWYPHDKLGMGVPLLSDWVYAYFKAWLNIWEIKYGWLTMDDEIFGLVKTPNGTDFDLWLYHLQNL